MREAVQVALYPAVTYRLAAAPTRPPQVKASQCFTKYHWRPEAEAAAASGGGVQVVATQVGEQGLCHLLIRSLAAGSSQCCPWLALLCRCLVPALPA